MEKVSYVFGKVTKCLHQEEEKREGTRRFNYFLTLRYVKKKKKGGKIFFWRQQFIKKKKKNSH